MVSSGTYVMLSYHRFPQVWEFDQDHQRWLPVAELALPADKADPVSTVAWAPNIGRFALENILLKTI